jgi:hypothetical protein
VNFRQRHALQEKILMTARVSMLLKPGWQEPEPIHVNGKALAHSIVG